jgi:geranylgeranyl diphosphate synthase type I
MKNADAAPLKALTPQDSKVLIDAFLMPLLQQLTEDARRINPHYETLWQDIQKLYNAGGKRLRSYMTLLAYESFTDTPIQAILPAAASQELLHMAMLIHDDIIDRDDKRYGVKNITGEYLTHYEELIPDQIDRRHYAHSAAILGGDLLISEAYALLSESDVDPSAILKVQQFISKAIFHVIGGELLDTEAAFRGGDAADPLTIAEQKTASYSFVSPFLMGATLAHAPKKSQDILQKLGEALGIAYQLRDDILGIFGDEAKTGKSVAGDIKEGKRTLLIEEFYRRGSEEDQRAFKALFGQQAITKQGIAHIKTLLTRSGAKEAVEILITAYYDHSLVLLNTLKIDDAHQAAFRQLIDLCLKREK